MSKALPATEKVKSTSVDAWGYDPQGGLLYIRFHSGAGYRYEGVPVAVWTELSSHPSSGAAVHKLLKGKYHGHRVEG